MDSLAQTRYQNSEGSVRASFGTNSEAALGYYAPFLDFVSGVQSPSPSTSTTLLDVGCGNGWSTHGFALAGYDATGLDLDPRAFEPPAHPRCRLIEASAMDLPFPSESFDIVATFQCIEHVPSPRRALDEMVRVCKPGGVVAIVGPNLVSPFPGLAYAVKPSSWKTLRFRRTPGMPRHPYGNTIPEILGVAVRRSFQIGAKLVRRSPHFTMREPDSNPPFHSDNDACYLCNPTDLLAYFIERGFQIERRGKPGRPPLSHLIAGGTWVAARKS